MTKIQTILFENQDLNYKNFHGKLMPNISPNTIIGVRIPILRKLAKDLFKTEPNLVADFFQELPHKFYEENNLHAFLLEQITDFEKCVFETERFLPFIDNWATCDSFKPKIFKKNLPKILELSKKWINSNHTYTIRYGIGCFMNYFLDKAFVPDFLDLVLNVKNDEYYIKMMKAWYFATALAKQHENTIKILETHKLDQWTHNKTIQKAIESYRIPLETKDYLRKLKIK